MTNPDTIYLHINKGVIMQDSIKVKIEKRAYELFLKRGGVHGYAMEDWAQAEKEINAELKPAKKVEPKPAAAAPVKAPAAPAQKPVQKSFGKKR
jgi:hypothetical protein